MLTRTDTATLTTSDPPEKEAPNRQKLSKAALDRLLRTRPHRQHIIWDTDEKGFHALISRGPKEDRQATVTLRVVYYLPSAPGKPKYIKIGRYHPERPGTYTYKGKDKNGVEKEITIKCNNIDDARTAASEIKNNAKRGLGPKAKVLSDRFEDVVTKFIDLHAKKNRSCKETQRIFNVYVLPRWRDMTIGDITRDHVTALLDEIEKGKIKHKGKEIGTTSQADAALVQLTKLFNWYATRVSKFRSPIVKGMHRGKPTGQRRRKRVLSDNELRIMWPILGGLGVYGAVIRSSLLTVQRFRKVAAMLRSDLKKRMLVPSHMHMVEGRWVPEYHINDVWDPTRDDDPENKRVSPVPLSEMAREVIDGVPIIDGEGDFVFSLNGETAFNGWSKYKKRLDKAMLDALRKQAQEAGEDPKDITLKPWQHRDLRRTARSLMPRTGIDRELAKRCLGHALDEMDETYNRYEYLREKQQAFAKLAQLIDHIVNPPPAARKRMRGSSRSERGPAHAGRLVRKRADSRRAV